MIGMLDYINFLVCFCGAVICWCRLGKLSGKKSKFSIGIQQIITASLMVASSISFMYGLPVTFIQLSLSIGTLANLVIGIPAWWKCQPSYSLIVHETTTRSEIVKHIERRYEGAK